MAQIKASLVFDAAKGSATVALELAGTTELEHELMEQFFTARSVSLVPFRNGDALESRFVVVQSDAFAKAQRAVENRIRARDGRPSLEDEEAARAKAAELQASLQKREDDAHAAGFDSYAAQQAAKAQAEQTDRIVSALAEKLKAK
jgi:hypothetical protein